MSHKIRTPSVVFQTDDGRKLYPGVYMGIVEEVQDPLNLGRVKVRVFTLHGDNTEGEATTEGMRWAKTVQDLSGGLNDVGSFKVPRVGAYVWVMFEACDLDSPVVVGTADFITDRAREVNTISNRSLPLQKATAGKCEDASGHTVPIEARSQPFNDPTLQVVFKSFKGHTVYYDDRDNNEKLVIIDRAGQCLVFESFVSESDNQGNNNKRGDKSALKGTQIDSAKCRIVFTDKKNQTLLFEPEKERVKLTSNSDGGGELEGGKNSQYVELDSKNKIVRIGSKAGGSETVKLTFDANSGNAILDVKNSATVNAKTTILNSDTVICTGNLVVSGDILNSGSCSVAGDDIKGGVDVAAAQIPP